MVLSNVVKCYFVTGTDTEVGKTVASVALLRAAWLKGFSTAGYKPVASGGKMTRSGLRNSDALALQRNSSVILSYQEVNPYVFSIPTSPHIVSASEKNPISFSLLSEGLRVLEKKAELVFIEGAGGWFTPLSEMKTFADWVIIEQLSVILVIGMRLGCINHALLSVLAIQQAGLFLAGWIVSNIVVSEKWHTEYLTTLKRMLPGFFIGEIPYIKDIDKCNITNRYLNLEYLI